MEEKFKKIKKIVEKELSCAAHNMDHVMRVYNLALNLSKDEKVDLEVLQAAVLLHDIARVKEDDDQTGKTDHAILGTKMAKKILKDLNFSEDKIEHIQNCIISHRSRTDVKPSTIEAKILFDADKLEAVGAIGIARIFGWIGKNGANIYKKVDIDNYIVDNLCGKINGRIQDKTKHSPQIELETKSKYLIKKMHTKKAKEICEERVEYLKQYLNRLEKEIHGEL